MTKTTKTLLPLVAACVTLGAIVAGCANKADDANSRRDEAKRLAFAVAGCAAAEKDTELAKPMPGDWTGCFCQEYWQPNNGPLAAVYYRASPDGSKQLLARQVGGGYDDTLLFDVDGDGVAELICQNHSQMGWHPWVSIYRLSGKGTEVCFGEELLESLRTQLGFRLDGLPWAGNMTLELDKETKSLSGGEGVKWFATDGEGDATGDDTIVEKIFLEQLKGIKLPFKPADLAFFDWLCPTEDQ